MRHTRWIALLFVASAVWAQPQATSPAIALREGRARIAAKNFAGAAQILESGLMSAAALTSETERAQATTALHFYAAVAYSGMHDDGSARRHLAEYFRLSPQSNHIDATKYDTRFVALFYELAPNRTDDEGDTFETYYPPFAPSGQSQTTTEIETVDSAARDLLGTAGEKREWRSATTDEGRQQFMHTFWSRRDPTPQTPENEFRDTFARRLAFAETVFGFDDKGGLSDRGRVFTLLGRPSFVRRRPIARQDVTGHNRIWVPSDTMINGTIEQWVYTRDQLPTQLSKPGITYRFVTQPGIGVGVLQKEDAYAMQQLEAAGHPMSRK